MKKIKDTPKCDGQWTQAKFNSFIKSLLRNGSMKWPPKNETLRLSRVNRGVYLCADCQQNVPATIKRGDGRIKNVFVDHINPIVDPAVGFTTWDDFIENLFCNSSNLQVLCYECHSKKTAAERRISNQRSKEERENSQ